MKNIEEGLSEKEKERDELLQLIQADKEKHQSVSFVTLTVSSL